MTEHCLRGKTLLLLSQQPPADVLSAMLSQGLKIIVVSPLAYEKIIDQLALQGSFPIEFIALESFKETAFLDKLLNLDIDYLCALLVKELIPQCLIDKAKCLAFNVHPAILPDYKGAYPYRIGILNGDTQTAISFHQLTDAFDEGPIYLSYPIKMSPYETRHSLIEKIHKHWRNAFERFFVRLRLGKIAFTENVGGEHYRRPTIRDSWLNPQNSAEFLERQIRANILNIPTTVLLDPACSPFGRIREVDIFEANVLSTHTNEHTPGHTVFNGDHAVMQCGSGSLLIRCLSLKDYGPLTPHRLLEWYQLTAPVSCQLLYPGDEPSYHARADIKLID
jgi:methionyl-tRNA formyltransferase